MPVSSLSPEELEEIGLLTIRFADIEEDIALCGETLLLRPELAGFQSSDKGVLKKHFSEKLDLFRSLVVASGVLYDIDREPVEEAIAELKKLGEERNAVVHGNLMPGQAGKPIFSRLGKTMQVDLQNT